MQAHLRAAGVETLIHYPIPIPAQPAMSALNPADCSIANRVCREIFSLPLHPRLPDEAIQQVAEAVIKGPSPASARHERDAQR